MLQAAEDQISRPSEFDADYLDALKEIVDRVKPLLEQEDVTSSTSVKLASAFSITSFAASTFSCNSATELSV